MTTFRRRRIGALAVIAALALLASACSTSDTGVRDFSEIQASDFEFVVGADGVGRMRVVTSIDAVCSIAWGETDALGEIGTDLDMGGTAHSDHEVLLVGAEPGKTYYFTVQGSDANGDLFQSELATFTLPETPEDDGDASGGQDHGEHGVNAAAGADVVEVSSVFSAGWVGQNAFDGDMSTEWATKDDGSDAFVTIDLGAPTAITGLEFITRTMSNGTATTTQFTVTVDGGETFGPFAAGDPSDSSFVEVAFEGQVLRFDVADSTGGNTGAIEIRAYTDAS